MDPDEFRPTKPISGVWLFLISRRRYMDAAVEHSAWLSLQAPDLREMFREGKFDPISDRTHNLELQRFHQLRRQLWASLGKTSAIALVAIVVGVCLDALDPRLPIDPEGLLGFCGTFLIGWAALFELGGLGLASWGGQTLSEIVHPHIFQILFVPGMVALLCSALL